MVGLSVIWAQNTYKIIQLAGDVYQIDYLPMKLTLGDGAHDHRRDASSCRSWPRSFPARRAGSLIPVDVLRYE